MGVCSQGVRDLDKKTQRIPCSPKGAQGANFHPQPSFPVSRQKKALKLFFPLLEPWAQPEGTLFVSLLKSHLWNKGLTPAGC